MLSVSEIFASIQGESAFAGLPCTFVRLTGCNLDCAYCDSRYARDEPGRDLEVRQVVEEAEEHRCQLVEVTGGEPFLQEDTPDLLAELVRRGKTVLVETNGSLQLPEDRDYYVIMDMKCPSSGEAGSHHPENPECLTPMDEVKFVISDHDDFNWAVDQVRRYDFIDRGIGVLISPVFNVCRPAELAGWVLESGLALRLQLQLHKIIWPEAERGR